MSEKATLSLTVVVYRQPISLIPPLKYVTTYFGLSGKALISIGWCFMGVFLIPTWHRGIKSSIEGEVEADGEMELDETEGIGEETGYLEARDGGVIALGVFWRILTVMWNYTYTYTYPAAVFSAVYLSGGNCRFSAWKVITFL